MIKICIFASGSGSNAEKIIEYFNDHEIIKIELICTNNEKAGVIERAQRLDKPCIIFKKHKDIISDLEEAKIDLIILAGYLKLIPQFLIERYPNRIINIHPALLPKYGGKGMYGKFVHEAVYANQELETGITIHLVNEYYDEGKHLGQFKVALYKDDSPDSIARKVHELEYAHFAPTIESYILENIIP